LPTHLRPILDVARDLGLDPDRCTPLGRHKAKVDRDGGASQATGRLVLVSAVTPTPAGEGKTTVSVGLTQGLQRIGARVALCLREPSLGPVFGVKGGGTGGGETCTPSPAPTTCSPRWSTPTCTSADRAA